MSSVDLFISSFSIDVTDFQSIKENIGKLEKYINEALYKNNYNNAVVLQKYLDFSNLSYVKSLRYSELQRQIEIINKEKKTLENKYDSIIKELVQTEKKRSSEVIKQIKIKIGQHNEELKKIEDYNFQSTEKSEIPILRAIDTQINLLINQENQLYANIFSKVSQIIDSNQQSKIVNKNFKKFVSNRYDILKKHESELNSIYESEIEQFNQTIDKLTEEKISILTETSKLENLELKIITEMNIIKLTSSSKPES